MKANLLIRLTDWPISKKFGQKIDRPCCCFSIAVVSAYSWGISSIGQSRALITLWLGVQVPHPLGGGAVDELFCEFKSNQLSDIIWTVLPFVAARRAACGLLNFSDKLSKFGSELTTPKLGRHLGKAQLHMGSKRLPTVSIRYVAPLPDTWLPSDIFRKWRTLVFGT